MANITLVGKCWAKEGVEFYYFGPAPECDNCKVASVCHNLEPGRRYRILEIRDTEHPCTSHESGVVAVEFEALPIQIALETVKALEGAVIKFPGNSCTLASCPEKRICTQRLIKKGPEDKTAFFGKGAQLRPGKEDGGSGCRGGGLIGR